MVNPHWLSKVAESSLFLLLNADYLDFAFAQDSIGRVIEVAFRYSVG